MTGNSDFILSLARKVYLEKPFYRWFYDNAGVDVESADIEDIPFLTKRDLFRYQEETGQEHYLPVPYAEKEIMYRTTSGTTGPPLPIPWLETEWFFACNNIYLNLLGFIKGRPRFLMPLNSDEEERARGVGSVIVSAPRDRLMDAPYVLDLIRRYRPNIFMDNSPGTWFNYMLDHGLDPRQAGIQLVIASPNPHFAQKLQGLGLAFASLFGCTEAGVFGYSHDGISETYHLSDAGPEAGVSSPALRGGLLGGIKGQLLTKLFPCDCYRGIDLNNLAGRRDIRVLTDDGRLELAGTGRMVITCANSVTPLVKYLNGDVVELSSTTGCSCGFAGRSMKFQQREHQVQVPYVGINGNVIRLEWITRELEAQGFKRVLPVYYRVDDVVRIVVTFVEDDAIETPSADASLAPRILAASCSIDIEVAENSTRDLFFYPAIRVPRGSIPIRDGDSLKARLYVDAVNGQVPKEYMPLHGLAQTLLNFPAIMRAASWFMMPPAGRPMAVEV